MLSVQIDQAHGAALLEPSGALSESDFACAAEVIDPWIEKHGMLKGLIIHTRSFPGWDSFGAFFSHLQFVRDRHERVHRVALVTDSDVVNAAENIGKHLVQAEIELFPYESLEEAKSWVAGAPPDHGNRS